MQVKSSVETKAQPIPSYIIERIESEWRQMRQGAAQPVKTAAAK